MIKALLGKCLSILLLYTACSVTSAQDVGVVQIGSNKQLHPSVALELRIQALIETLSISGEQEPSFRVAMKQVSELEADYRVEHGQADAEFSSDSALLSAAEKLLTLVLYPTQISAFLELEQDYLWQMRGRP